MASVSRHHSPLQLDLWPGAVPPRRILFHSDFDGVCAAAVLFRMFGETQRLEPIDYSYGKRWLHRRLTQSAVVDFLYHPTALWWFDHHDTSFRTAEAAQSYVPDARHRWDTSYQSCPPLVLDVLSESFDVSPLRQHFAAWVPWANIIDSAKYDSPQQATLGSEPCLRINQALGERRDPWLRKYLVKEIARGATPENVMEDDEVAPHWRSYDASAHAALDQMAHRVLVRGRAAMCDMLDADVRFLRYGVYCLVPEAGYSAIAYNSGAGSRPYKISLSRNPWKPTPSAAHSLGELAREFGGGGRRDVGSVSFATKRDCVVALQNAFWRLATHPDEGALARNRGEA